MPILHILIENRKERTISNSLYEISKTLVLKSNKDIIREKLHINFIHETDAKNS